MQSFQKEITLLNNERKNSKFSGYFVCLIASLFFLYEFIQINMFNSIEHSVVLAYKLDGIGIGFLSSIYFYSTVLFLLPAGQILDKFSPKLVILTTIFICIFGLTGFALTHNIFVACFCRFLEGIGSAFCFLGNFRIASNWVSKSELAFMTGAIVAIGMIGGIVAQTPLMLLVEKYGWRNSLFMDAFFGVFVFITIFLFVQDHPNEQLPLKNPVKTVNYFELLKISYLNKNNWLCGLYTCLMNSPMVVLGALWGSLYLKNAHGLSTHDASNVIGYVFIGCIIGSPFFGFLSSFFTRKILMITGGILTSVVLLAILSAGNASEFNFAVLFFLLGLFSSAQIFGYPTAAQNGPEEISAMSASVVSFTTMSGYIVFQPLFGYLLDI